jgi:hypothetical protein
MYPFEVTIKVNMTQKQMIREHLLRFGSITPALALNEYACARLSARIAELRADGYCIETVERKTINRFGKKIQYTEKYVLKEGGNTNEPKEAEDMC